MQESSDAAPLAPVLTGTMGWSYEDWRGPFYTRDTPPSRMLQEYARIFAPGTVELDSTFYGFPRPETLAGWLAQTPDSFRFSAKVPRAVTHERRLNGAVETATDFARLMTRGLDGRLCALLLQLPPDLTVEERPTLEAFIEGVLDPRAAPDAPWVVELRSPTWAGTDIAAWLAERGMVAATTERLDLGGPLRYVRLLGIENSVARFDAAQLDRAADIDSWARRIDAARRAAPETVLVYVRNFFEGHAPATLAKLRERLGLPTAIPPGQQQMSLF